MQTACRPTILLFATTLTVVAVSVCAASDERTGPSAATGPLAGAAQTWARAQRPAAPGNMVLLQPIDPRVASTACPAGWRFDLPFADTQAVRARCAEPQLQVFVRATVALRGAEARPGPSLPQEPPAPPSVRSVRPVPAAPAPGLDAPVGTSAAQPRPAAAQSRQVLTLRQDLRRGTLLEARHVGPSTGDVPLQRGLGDPLEDTSALEHTELVRDKMAGQVLYSHDIQPALLVRKGQLIVVMTTGVPGLTITARLEALQDGRLGETIRLRNRDSGRIVSGVVNGPNAARLP